MIEFSNKLISIDAEVKLSCVLPPKDGDFNREFCLIMQKLSAHCQKSNGSLQNHTLKDGIPFLQKQLLQHFRSFKPGYLFDDEMESDPLSEAWSHHVTKVPTSVEEGRRQMREYFDATAKQISPEAVEELIQSFEEKVPPYQPRCLGGNYILCWIIEFSKWLKTSLRVIYTKNQDLIDLIAPTLKIGELIELEDDTWISLFQSVTDKKIDDRVLKGSILPCLYKRSTLIGILEHNHAPEKTNYKRPSLDHLQHAMEFVWLTMWSFLDKSTHKAVHALFSNAKPDEKKFPQESIGDQKHIERTLTCIVHVITCAVYASRDLWRNGMPMSREGRWKNARWNKMCNNGLEALLLRDAINDAIKFFSKIGFNPVYPSDLKYDKCNDMREIIEQAGGRKWHAGALIAADLVWFYVISFAAQLSREITSRPNPTKAAQVHCGKKLIGALSQKFNVLEPDESWLKKFIIERTRGGDQSFDLRRKTLSDAPAGIQVVGLLSSKGEFTHEINRYCWKNPFFRWDDLKRFGNTKVSNPGVEMGSKVWDSPGGVSPSVHRAVAQASPAPRGKSLLPYQQNVAESGNGKIVREQSVIAETEPQNEETPGGGGGVVAANGGKTAEEGESAKKRAERSPKTETEKNDMTLKKRMRENGSEFLEILCARITEDEPVNEQVERVFKGEFIHNEQSKNEEEKRKTEFKQQWINLANNEIAMTEMFEVYNKARADFYMAGMGLGPADQTNDGGTEGDGHDQRKRQKVGFRRTVIYLPASQLLACLLTNPSSPSFC
jgi:hypothetical protein